MNNHPALQFSPMGENALLCQLPQAPLSLDVQKCIWLLAKKIKDVDHVLEVVPGMNNLLVLFDSRGLSFEGCKTAIDQQWQANNAIAYDNRIFQVNVRYGKKYGEDISWLAEQAGLSIEDFAQLHASGNYTVYALGSQPGFGYLGGMDIRLASPRRQIPRLSVRAGSVIIGGSQTAVQACTTPSGWHIIGITNTIFFDASAEEPALLRPGDQIKFEIEDIS